MQLSCIKLDSVDSDGIKLGPIISKTLQAVDKSKMQKKFRR